MNFKSGRFALDLYDIDIVSGHELFRFSVHSATQLVRNMGTRTRLQLECKPVFLGEVMGKQQQEERERQQGNSRTDSRRASATSASHASTHGWPTLGEPQGKWKVTRGKATTIAYNKEGERNLSSASGTVIIWPIIVTLLILTFRAEAVDASSAVFMSSSTSPKDKGNNNSWRSNSRESGGGAGASAAAQETASEDSIVSVDPCCWNSSYLDYNENDSVWQSHNNDSGSLQDHHLYDVPVYLVVLLSLLYGVISFTAVIGNVLVLWVVTSSHRMRTKTNIFIANLALADIIIAIFAIPFQFQAALLQRWNLPDFMCAFCPFVQVLSVNVSVFTLSAIALDRYRAILYPFKAIRISKREAVYTVVSIWILSIFIALPQELDYKVIDELESGKVKPFCAPVLLSSTFRKSYILGLVVIQYVLPLVIISVAYAEMARKLWGSNAPGNKEESRDENALRNKKKVVKMLAVVVLIFALCWLPLQMYNFFQTMTSINEYQYINIIWFCFHWLAMSNSCYNPFIYAIFSDKFQTEFKSRLHCLGRLRPRDLEDGFCSEASDFEMSRARVVPSKLSRRDKMSQSTRVVRISTNIDSQKRNVDSEDGMMNATYSRPISTICNNIKTAEINIPVDFSKSAALQNSP